MIGHEGYSTSLVAGCVEYMAPELFINEDDDDELDEADGPGEVEEPPFSKMSDVYAFSMLTFEVWYFNG